MQTGPVDGIHRTINQRIDEIYIETIERAADLRSYIDRPRGEIAGAYLRFKHPFYQLFLLTHGLKEMRSCADVAGQVERWIVTDPISLPSAKEGLQLLTQYQRSLFDNLIISRRDGR